jgi:hypothetical protein
MRAILLTLATEAFHATPKPSDIRKAIEILDLRARYNALQSGVSFREYMIRLLEASQPIQNGDR